MKPYKYILSILITSSCSTFASLNFGGINPVNSDGLTVDETVVSPGSGGSAMSSFSGEQVRLISSTIIENSPTATASLWYRFQDPGAVETVSIESVGFALDNGGGLYDDSGVFLGPRSTGARYSIRLPDWLSSTQGVSITVEAFDEAGGAISTTDFTANEFSSAWTQTTPSATAFQFDYDSTQFVSGFDDLVTIDTGLIAGAPGAPTTSVSRVDFTFEFRDSLGNSIDPTSGVDFRFTLDGGEFVPVPEPSGFLFISLSGICFMLRRKRV